MGGDDADRSERSGPGAAGMQQRDSEEGRREHGGDGCNECTRREACPATVDQPARKTCKSQRYYGTRSGRPRDQEKLVRGGVQRAAGGMSSKDMHERPVAVSK
jgi:hypothetical protein